VEPIDENSVKVRKKLRKILLHEQTKRRVSKITEACGHKKEMNMRNKGREKDEYKKLTSPPSVNRLPR
jgi:hypothetical protein